MGIPGVGSWFELVTDPLRLRCRHWDTPSNLGFAQISWGAPPPPTPCPRSLTLEPHPARPPQPLGPVCPLLSCILDWGLPGRDCPLPLGGMAACAPSTRPGTPRGGAHPVGPHPPFLPQENLWSDKDLQSPVFKTTPAPGPPRGGATRVPRSLWRLGSLVPGAPLPSLDGRPRRGSEKGALSSPGSWQGLGALKQRWSNQVGLATLSSPFQLPYPLDRVPPSLKALAEVPGPLPVLPLGSLYLSLWGQRAQSGCTSPGKSHSVPSICWIVASCQLPAPGKPFPPACPLSGVCQPWDSQQLPG